MMVGGSLAAVFAIAVLLIFKPDNHRRKEKHKEFEGETAAKTAPSSTPSAPVNPAIYFPTEELASKNPLDRVSDPGFAMNPTPTTSPSPATGSTNPSGSPSASPASVLTTTGPTATPALDPLNKGDGLTPEETKFKVTLTAKEDAWVRYRSDELQTGIMILRKGRSLVIRARQKLRFETRHPEHFQVKTRSMAPGDLKLTKAEVATDASLQEYVGQDLGSKELPEAIPTPRGP
jgi:hypothetical protein